MTLDPLELQAMQLELRRLRLEMPTDSKGTAERTERLRELTLRVADMKRACWGD